MKWFFSRKKTNDVSSFINSIQTKIENNTLSEVEKTALMRFYLTCQHREYGLNVEDEKCTDYIFLGWWVAQHVNLF